MSERLSAIYQAKSVCVYELVDENQQYIEETRGELRMASQAGQLCHQDSGSINKGKFMKILYMNTTNVL